MLKMFRLFAARLLLVFVALLQAPVFALDNDERLLLRKELVVNADGKYVHDQTNVCRVLLPTSLGGGYSDPFYVRRQIESSTEIMSRDRFVAISTRILLTNRIVFAQTFSAGTAAAEAFDSVKCSPIEAPQKAIDFVVSIVMQDDGIQATILDTASGKKSLDRLSWSKMLNF